MKMYVIKRTKDSTYYSTEIDTTWYYDASEMSANCKFRKLEDIINRSHGYYLDLDEISHINLYTEEKANLLVKELTDSFEEDYEVIELGEL